MFNNYVWGNYLKAGGEKVAEMFERNLSGNYSEEYADAVSVLRRTYCPSEKIIKDEREQLLNLFSSLIDNPISPDDAGTSIQDELDDFFSIGEEDGLSSQQFFHWFSGSIAYFTTLLAIISPDLFVPYYFTWNFNVLELIAREFEIDLPSIPIKKDYRGRFYYYGEVCKALHDFREEYHLSPYELCAFLYDFAPKYIGGIDSYIIKGLPVPKSAYFIGGASEDRFLTDDPDAITPWQCSPDTQAGDMIVMYLRTPVSAIDSIWQSVSVGFNDPFFYYYRCTYIAKPQKLKQISLKQLQQDPIFKELPIVRKNMQGVNGVELLPSVYNHLLEITDSSLPRLKYLYENTDMAFQREKDVENKLIKPLLERLGYAESDYQQQLYIAFGNHNHDLIPDFVIHPVVTRGHYAADFVVEAKLSLPSQKLLENAKMQVRSYAKMLNAKYAVVASREMVWVMGVADDYTENILACSWAELKNEDCFFQVFKLLGNGKV